MNGKSIYLIGMKLVSIYWIKFQQQKQDYFDKT
jgi:hypothetical protein